MPVRPSKIIGIGRNYLDHARELGNEMPAVPILFFKPTTALIASGDTILLPSVSTRVEFEAEIGVVIGKRVRNVDPTAAERAIDGFVCVNDVTCRDLQKTDGQWGRAKGFDTFCPVGPKVAAGLDWRTLELICRVNGVQRQRARSTDMALLDSRADLVSERHHDPGARRSHRHRHARWNRTAASRRRGRSGDPRCGNTVQPCSRRRDPDDQLQPSDCRAYPAIPWPRFRPSSGA